MLQFPPLPQDFVCPLPQLGLVSVSGTDKITYLQSQLTQDLTRYFSEPASAQTALACHCDAKGKIWAVYRLVAWQESLLLLADKSALPRSLAELKKYGVFSKVDIAMQSALEAFGGQGPRLQAWIIDQFDKLPDAQTPVVSQDKGVAIYLPAPSPRYLLLLTEKCAIELKQQLEPLLASANLWTLLDIRACEPVICESTQAEFIPQMLNMHVLDAISFKKGCYMGQEVVARAKYLGRNKRAAFVLGAETLLKLAPGELLESRAGDNWRPGGTVLSCATWKEQTWLIAVLANDTPAGEQLRSKSYPETLLEVQPLPYQLEV
ncbi:tRNA-modifying protein YgfZ [Aliiglaciecola sp. CAU 1673]|uniref:tRNA-modifying protein YgfZ n=1 Tax=Aliiglaciecola sp. CAU 1673 TaxID=3032595 RepID=UPI0023DA67F5|nr:tRNA-modifying protein YgfZ [Aliiglaciecola sp. CAU 1673]MDF2177989.1 tRNA-modifying protein YgfZ [Aliiglaciecola sp. CAU 1673]